MIEDNVYEFVVSYIDQFCEQYGINCSVEIDDYNNLILVDMSFYSPPLYYSTSELKRWLDRLIELEVDLESDVKDISPNTYIELIIYRITGDGFNIGIKVE